MRLFKNGYIDDIINKLEANRNYTPSLGEEPMPEQITYTDEDAIKEQLWETEMIRKGRDAYLSALRGANLADTDVGTSLFMTMIPNVVAAVKVKQEEHAAILVSGAKRKNGANHLLPLVRADLIAVAIVQHFLRNLLREGGEPPTLRSMLDAMEAAYIEAMALQMWEQNDVVTYNHFWKTQADKLATIGAGTRHANRAKTRLKARLSDYYTQFKEQHDTTQHMQLSVATELLSCIGFKRVKTISEAEAMTLTETDGEESVMLVDYKYCKLLSDHGPFSSLFILRDSTTRYNRAERLMYLSEEAEDIIDYRVERGCIGNVSLRPMLVKPKRWILTTP